MQVELHAQSAFSFLRGASQPEELMRTAAALGYQAVAVCDHGGFYGSARAHAAAQEHGVRALVGTTLEIQHCGWVPVLARTRAGYAALCRWHTNGHLGEGDPVHWQPGDLVCLTGCREGALVGLLRRRKWAEARRWVERLMARFGRGHVCIEVFRHRCRGDGYLNRVLAELAEQVAVQVVAVNAPLYARRSDRLLADAFACVREGTTLEAAGRLLGINSERYLKPPEALSALFADKMEWVRNAEALAASLDFGLESLGYHFPRFHDGQRYLVAEEENHLLREVSLKGAKQRYGGISSAVREQLEHELGMIERLGFAGYFLIVWDIVCWAQRQGMLCQGRGSAANSVVCYALGITNADPVGSGLLFERFLSENRKSWPDIDVDFPSGEKREAVIQYVYEKYAPRGAAMTANVITYRQRSAFREMSKVLGFGTAVADRFSSYTAHLEVKEKQAFGAALDACGVEQGHPHRQALYHLFQATLGKPRHLGQHPGGMVICDQGLDHIVPLEPATMPGRKVLQWDKDDCDALGIVKVDLLGLGMLAAMEDMLRLCRERGRPVELATLPKDDTATYDLMCRADTVGTFQVESRAQMSTLPVMRPRCFYDVVIEVALIRPGPIVGDLVHPYLNRRSGRDAVNYIHPLFEPVLKRTLGVPLFQEQVLKMAMLIADFTGSDAEELRKAMSFQRSHEKMQTVTAKLEGAMLAKGVSGEVRQKVIAAIGSFALYGFPESHAISFGLIAYASCWLKQHRAAEFYAGLLNNQPMGFYSPASLVQDARLRGIKVKPVCVQHSTMETLVLSDTCIRLGLGQLVGVSVACQSRIVEQRSQQKFLGVQDFLNRVKPNKRERRAMAESGALNGLPQVEHRRDAMWRAEAVLAEDDLFYQLGSDRALKSAPLKRMSRWERLRADLSTTGVTTGGHPMWVWRREVDPEERYYRAVDLADVAHGQTVFLTGMVICRQRPSTGKGNCFVSMEDETGMSSVFVPRSTYDKFRLVIVTESFLLVYGRVQVDEGGCRSVYAMEITPLPQAPGGVAVVSHDFH